MKGTIKTEGGIKQFIQVCELAICGKFVDRIKKNK